MPTCYFCSVTAVCEEFWFLFLPKTWWAFRRIVSNFGRGTSEFFAGGNSVRIKNSYSRRPGFKQLQPLAKSNTLSEQEWHIEYRLQRRSGHIWHTNCKNRSFTGTPESSSSEMREFEWYFVGFIDENVLCLYTSDLRLHVRRKTWEVTLCRHMDTFYLLFALYLVFVGGTMNRTPASKSKMRFYFDLKCFCFMVGGWNIWSPVF